MEDYNIANRGDKCPRGHRGRMEKWQTTGIIKSDCESFRSVAFRFRISEPITRRKFWKMDGEEIDIDENRN